MPFVSPRLVLIDYKHFENKEISTEVIYSPEPEKNEPIPYLELVWTAANFAGVVGRKLLVHVGLNVPMVWNSKGTETRFIFTFQGRGPDGTIVSESMFARGDVSGSAGTNQAFALESFYGPIPLPVTGERIIFRAMWATLRGGTSTMAKGDLGTNEFRALAYLINEAV